MHAASACAAAAASLSASAVSSSAAAASAVTTSPFSIAPTSVATTPRSIAAATVSIAASAIAVSPTTTAISSSTSADCNGDAVPDECQIAEFPGLDIDLNGILDECEEIGERHCPPVAFNSSGRASSVIVRGVETLSLDDITLTANGLPRNAFGYFITSRTQGYVYPVGYSQGALCVVGQIGRYTTNPEIVVID